MKIKRWVLKSIIAVAFLVWAGGLLVIIIAEEELLSRGGPVPLRGRAATRGGDAGSAGLEACVIPAPGPVAVAGSVASTAGCGKKRCPGGRDRPFAFDNPPFGTGRARWRRRAPPPPPDGAVVVTIVTPTNDPKEEFFLATRRSVLGQTLPHLRWLVVDDGSADAASRALLADHRAGGARADPRIVVAACPPPGPGRPCNPAGARNHGLSLVRSEFVVMLDDDDLLEPTYIEKLLWLLRTNPEYDYANTYSAGFGAQNYTWGRTFYESSLKANQQTITGLLRVSALERVTDYPAVFDIEMGEGREDWKLWLTLKNAGLHGATLPEILFWYRIKERRRDWDFLDGRKPAENTELSIDQFPTLQREGWVNPTLEEKPVKALPPLCLDCLREKGKEVDLAVMATTSAEEDTCQKHMVMVIPWMAMGGADAVNVRLIEVLASRGWRVTVACTLSTSATSLDSPDLEFSRARIQRHTEDIFVLPHFLRTEHFGPFLAHLVRSRGARALLVSNSYAGYALLPFLRAAAPRVALLSYVHMRNLGWLVRAPCEPPGRHGLGRGHPGGFSRLDALYSGILDASLFVSEDERRWVSSEARRAGRIWGPGLAAAEHHREVVYYGIDLDEFDGGEREAYRAKLGLHPDTFAVLFAGRIVEQKQPDVAIRVIHSLMIQHGNTLNIHLLVAGDGPLLDRMKKYSRQNGLTAQVTFLGIVNQVNMRGVMAASDVFFMPSKMEGLAIALLEAVAAGLVPVVSDVGGQGEVVVDGTGYLVPAHNTRAMVKALAAAAANRSTRRAMVAAGRRHLQEEFSQERMASRLDATLTAAGARAARRGLPGPADVAAVGADYPRAVEEIRHVWVARNASFVGRMNGLITGHRKAVTRLSVARQLATPHDLVSRMCSVNRANVADWLAAVNRATMCGSGLALGKDLQMALGLQCGQWCVFEPMDPDSGGWSFHGKCFTRFGRTHKCHTKYGNLKAPLQKYDLVSRMCGANGANVTDWLSAVQLATMCSPSGAAIGSELRMALSVQCGQWCVFEPAAPDSGGWSFNGKCFARFGWTHPCHNRYADLKASLQKRILVGDASQKL